jgi:NADPH:quinone reductase-like Zn-dependent oxidoreductase
MRALMLHGDRDLRLEEIAPPPPPGPGEVQVRVRAIGLNYLDFWGYRGMAFAKRKMPQIAGVEAAGEIVALGEGAARFRLGQRVALYGADTCGVCPACRRGQDNLCEDVAGIRGFHLDGFGRELVNRSERLTIAAPDALPFEQIACAPVGFGTVQHMLFDNARLEPGETILIHAAGSGVGSAAIRMAKAIGCEVIATAGDDAKCDKARALGADHVINYRADRFEGRVRRITGKRGVDVVFEHVGADTWAGSLLCLKRGGRLVTCGATSGPSASLNLMQLFQQQYRIIGSFGCRIQNVAEALEKMAAGLDPVIDSTWPLESFADGLARIENRKVFGKVVLTV